VEGPLRRASPAGGYTSLKIQSGCEAYSALGHQKAELLQLALARTLRAALGVRSLGRSQRKEQFCNLGDYEAGLESRRDPLLVGWEHQREGGLQLWMNVVRRGHGVGSMHRRVMPSTRHVEQGGDASLGAQIAMELRGGGGKLGMRTNGNFSESISRRSLSKSAHRSIRERYNAGVLSRGGPGAH